MRRAAQKSVHTQVPPEKVAELNTPRGMMKSKAVNRASTAEPGPAPTISSSSCETVAEDSCDLGQSSATEDSCDYPERIPGLPAKSKRLQSRTNQKRSFSSFLHKSRQSWQSSCDSASFWKIEKYCVVATYCCPSPSVTNPRVPPLRRALAACGVSIVLKLPNPLRKKTKRETENL